MSFVGPRPERPYFVGQYVVETPGYRERFNVKPGVTGLAQVSGGYATTPERKLKYDLIYMYHQTLAMDAQIVAETLRVVLTGARSQVRERDWPRRRNGRSGRQTTGRPAQKAPARQPEAQRQSEDAGSSGAGPRASGQTRTSSRTHAPSPTRRATT